MPKPATIDLESVAERRRSEILEAAEFLIALHGYDALRLRDVAQRAGVSIGMIQHYFVTRDDLLRETVRSASENRVRLWAGDGANEHPLTDRGAAAERLMTLLESSVADHHRCVVWVETCAAATRHPELRDDVVRTREAWMETIRRVVAAGVASGDFAPRGDVEEVVSLLVSLIDGVMLAVATGAGGEPVRDLRRAAEDALGIA